MTAKNVVSELRFRRPTEADHPGIVAAVDDWWGGRRIHHLLPRLWFQHFTGTSWLAETEAGRPAGFIVGFISPDDPSIAYVHMVGTGPNHRRGGLGRELYRRFFDDIASHGVERVRAITWPGNRVSVAFHAALGFRPLDGPGSQNLYGTLAFPDYDFAGEDRVVFERSIGPGSGPA
jgi:GNAT superfamily N-acetyltransferase